MRIEIENKISVVLRKHFPKAEETELLKHAGSIYGGWSTSRTMQTIERSNITSEKDIEQLRKAEKHLLKAASELEKIGWHGGKALLPSAERYKNERYPEHWVSLVGNTEAAGIIRKRIIELANNLSSAAKQVEPDAQPIFEYLGEQYPKGGGDVLIRLRISQLKNVRKSLKTYWDERGKSVLTRIKRVIPPMESSLIL